MPAPTDRPEGKPGVDFGLTDGLRGQAQNGQVDRDILARPEEQEKRLREQERALQKKADGLALATDDAKQEAKDKDRKDLAERRMEARRRPLGEEQ